MEIEKTLIGKDGFLFLKNDAAKELEVHCNNLLIPSNDFYKKYEKYYDKMLIIIFPNKSYIYKQFLPEGYIPIYRPAFHLYNNYFKEHLIDGYKYLQDIEDTYYKTDTHINFKGAYIIYKVFVERINTLFNLNIIEEQLELSKIDCESLSLLGIGIGDLTWDYNLGSQKLINTKDTYYSSLKITDIYCKIKIGINNNIKLLILQDGIFFDNTNNEVGNILDWNIISKYLLYNKNNEKNCIDKKVLIFYDSFLLSSLSLYIKIFSEIYLCKQIFSSEICDIINPDYIFEFRVERFLL